ncbi:MAG: DUF4390 domain-containing protein [Aquabacterium sp.]|nr:DUF4390 domain-containing protein [Aquabacterium sp.]
MRRELMHLLLPRIAHRTGRWCLLALLWALSVLATPAWAQAVELKQLKLERRDGELMLDFSTRMSLGPAIEDALHRGVPMYFNAQATVYRNRWYWRDERMGRATRTWRLAYQPLTASWRLSLGGLSQGYDSLSEALAPLTRVSGWRLLELEKIEPGERYYVDFSFKLDNSQLPQPMQIDLGGDWKLGVERSLRVE